MWEQIFEDAQRHQEQRMSRSKVRVKQGNCIQGKVTGVKYAFTINAQTIFDQELNRKDSAFTVSTVETFVSDTKVEVWDVRKKYYIF